MKSIAGDVAAMESELISLREENRHQGQRIAVLEWETDAQKAEIARLKAERDHQMRRADSIKVLLDQTGSSLVNGIQKFNATEREVHLIGEEPPPKFIADAKTKAVN